MIKRILVAKRKKLVCEYWCRILAEANHQTLNCSTSADDVFRAVHERSPDLFFTEFAFANDQGFETARQAMVMLPSLRSIMVLPPEAAQCLAASQINISGYLPEDMEDPAELLRCIDRIDQGYCYVSPVFGGVFQMPSGQYTHLVNGLTDRRKQVLRLVAEGLTARQIGLEMNITEATVRHHKEDISALLGLSGTYQLKILAGSVAHLLK